VTGVMHGLAAAGLLVTSTMVLSQGLASPDRRFGDRASWVQLDLPSAWFAPRYSLTARSGAAAAERQPGAAYWLSFEYLPQARELAREPLLRIMVYPLGTWQRLNAQAGAPAGEVLAKTDSRVYLGVPTQGNPYPDASEDAKQFDAMRLSPELLRAAFSIMGQGERAAAAGPKSAAAPSPALNTAPRLLAAGRLVCSGRDPAWSLVITKGSTARLSTRDAKGGKSQAMKGRMEFAEPAQAVWRGRAGKGGDWVAVIREDSCEMAPREAGSHVVLLSRPEGRVWQGCCRIMK